MIAKTAQIAEAAALEPGAFVDHEAIEGHDVQILHGAKAHAFT